MRREIGHAELKVFHSRPNYFNDLIQLAYKLQKSRLEKTSSLNLLTGKILDTWIILHELRVFKCDEKWDVQS